MIKRLGLLLALMAIVVGACSSGGSGATAAPTAAASAGASVAAPSEGAPSAAASGDASSAKLVIWADDKRAAAIKPLAQQWATDNGVNVEVQAITENLTTQFKTASQQGTGPDVVVWAHDAVADFVQNSAIDPVDDAGHVDVRSARGQGHDLPGPALRRAVLDREHRADPEHGPRARVPGHDGGAGRDRRAAGQGQEGNQHHGPPGRPEGRRLPHLPAVHVGRRFVLRHDGGR